MKQFFSNFNIFMKEVWRVDKKYFLYLFFNFIGIVIFSYYIIQAPKIILDMIESSSVDIKKIGLIFTILLCSAFTWTFSKVLYTPIGNKIRYGYLLKIFDQYTSIPYEEYEDSDVQKNVWKIMRPVNGIYGIQSFYTSIGLFIANTGVLLVSIGILFEIKAWISLIIIIWFCVYTFLSIRAENKAEEEFQKNITLNREEWYLDDLAVDMAYGKEIRVFQLQNWLQDKLNILHDRLNIINKKNETTFMIPGVLNDCFEFIRDGLIYFFLITLFFKKQINIGEFASYSVLIMQLNNSIMSGTENLKDILSKHDSYSKMLDFISIPKQSNKGKNLPDSKDKLLIEFKDVWFKYPESKKWIYENLNFTVRKGEKIAIVGLNGAGKTTMLKLLLRLYKPTKGTISLNGVDIWDYKLEEYFRLFAPVFQEINIFPFSIRENMTFGREADDKVILKAIEDSGLELEDLGSPDLDKSHMTRYLHGDGISLSGGQSQKFVTARAFASKRPIYILDEPTSALDPIAEYDFYHKIEKIMKEETVLFVSHRLASTRFCSKILLVEDRTIKEQGSHDELIKRRGRYEELFNIQAKYYKSGEAI